MRCVASWKINGGGGGGADELAEEGVGVGRAGAELGVELDTDEEGVIAQLHDLGQVAVRRAAADDQAGLGQLAPEAAHRREHEVEPLAVDAGPLEESWRQQPGSPVYGKDHDAEGVRAALAEASPQRPAACSAA